MPTETIRVIAWTGGSSPPEVLPPDVEQFSEQVFAEQMAEWKDYWDDEPNEDTRGILLRRAAHDAWATLRHKYEG